MATRYWVGGSGTWNTSTTNWSLTNGGAGGASTPGTGDDVFITSLSGSPVITVGTARTVRSITTTGATCTIAGSQGLTLTGSTLTLSATTTWSNTGTLAFSTGANGSITSSGVVINSPITVSNTTSFTLNDNLTSTKAFTLANLTFNLSNFTLSVLSFSATSSLARTYNFGTGNITCTGTGTVFNSNGTNLTVTGTPTVNIINNSATAASITASSFTSANAFNFNITTGTYALTFSTNATFNNLNLTGFSGTLANAAITIYGNFLVPTTTVITAGSNTWTFAPPTGTTKTITCNGKTLDFPIILNGAGTLQLADTFAQGASRALTLTAGTLDINSKTNTFGTLTITAYPTTPIINGILNASAITQSSGTVTIPATQTIATTGLYSLGSSSTLDLATNNATLSVGRITLGISSIVAFGTSGQVTLTGNNATIYQGASGATCTGTTKFVCTYSGSTGTRVFAMGSSLLLNVSAGAVTGLSIGTAGTDTVSFTGTVNTLDFTGFTGTLSNTAFSIFANLILASGMNLTAGANALTFSAFGGTQTITSNGKTLDFPVTKSSASTLTLVDDLTIGSTRLYTNAGTLDLATNNRSLSTGSISLSNTTVVFGSASNTITLTGNNSTIYTATTPTFTGTVKIVSNYSGSTGTRTFSMGSSSVGSRIDVAAGAITGLSFGTAGTDIVSIGGNIGSLNLTGFTGTLGAVLRNLSGDFTVPGSGPTLEVATASTQDTVFDGTSGVQTLTTNGTSIPFPITQSGAGGTLLLDDDLTLIGTYGELTLTQGTLDANNYNVNITSFVTSGSSVRTLTMGSGTWTISGTGTLWTAVTTNLTFNPNTSNIVLSDTSTTSRTFAGGGLTYNNLQIGGSTGTSTLTITGSNTFGTISSTKSVAHTIVLTNNTTTTCANWTVNGTSGNIVTIRSSANLLPATLALSSGTVTVDYAAIKDINASPADTWTAQNSALINSTNWIIGTNTKKVIPLFTGTSWTVPTDWDSNNNTVYIFGGGGGGRTGANSTVGGAGGGGGGFAQVNNFVATPGASISYAIGAGGTGGSTGGNGGATTFDGATYSASGGFGATNGGAGGTGTGGDVNYTGGSGGTTTAVSTKGGSGGGGAAGPLGNGGNGATGTQGTLAPSGGGGGNSGGSAGGLPNGGNNASGTGGGVGGGVSGIFGGGGAGAISAGMIGGNGGDGIEILGIYGGGGGSGGNGNQTTPPSPGAIGGGGGGGGFQTIGAVGDAGAPGGIIIVYSPFVESTSSNFFLLF